MQAPAPLPAASLLGWVEARLEELRLGGWGVKSRAKRLSLAPLWLTKAVNYWRLVGTVPAFVLPDICYMSPAASWRLRLTARREQWEPVSTYFSSLLRSFLTQAVPWCGKLVFRAAGGQGPLRSCRDEISA